MLIFRYLLKETLKSQLAIFLILMAIFITLRFVRVLGDASDGDIPASLVIGFLALYSPVLASLVLPISVFLGIMLAYGRLYVDSEMAVMKACGISEWYVTRVMLVLSLFMMAVTAIVTLWLSPWSAESEYQLRDKASAEAGIAAIIPGRFQQTSNDQAVIFIHDVDSESERPLKRIFLSRHQDNEMGDTSVHVVYAQDGEVKIGRNNIQTLVLNDGKQYEGNVDQKNYRIVEFDEYQIQIGKQTQTASNRKMVAVPTMELWRDGSVEALSELQWRIAIPLSIPFLVLIAVPLSAVDPRQGRFGKMFPALLLYLGYFLLLMATRRALEDGKIPIQIGLWWVHGVMLIIGMALIARDRKSGAWFRSVVLRRN